jgi:transcriptional regulator with XRE-family HTH domain
MLRYLGIDGEYTREEISAYERGVRLPPLHVLLKYSKAARVWVNVLIDDGLDLPMRLPAQRMHEGVPRSTLGKQDVISNPNDRSLLGISTAKKAEGVKRAMKRRNRKL